MTISSSVHAFLFFALLAPAVASADGGVIRFVGAIVEPGNCQSRVTQAGPASHPQVSCAPVAGKRTQAALEAASRVKTSVRQLAPETETEPARAAAPKRYLVLLEYP